MDQVRTLTHEQAGPALLRISELARFCEQAGPIDGVVTAGIAAAIDHQRQHAFLRNTRHPY